jgi:hypothetical protein
VDRADIARRVQLIRDQLSEKMPTLVSSLPVMMVSGKEHKGILELQREIAAVIAPKSSSPTPEASSDREHLELNTSNSEASEPNEAVHEIDAPKVKTLSEPKVVSNLTPKISPDEKRAKKKLLRLQKRHEKLSHDAAIVNNPDYRSDINNDGGNNSNNDVLKKLKIVKQKLNNHKKKNGAIIESTSAAVRNDTNKKQNPRKGSEDNASVKSSSTKNSKTSSNNNGTKINTSGNKVNVEKNTDKQVQFKRDLGIDLDVPVFLDDIEYDNGGDDMDEDEEMSFNNDSRNRSDSSSRKTRSKIIIPRRKSTTRKEVNTTLTTGHSLSPRVTDTNAANDSLSDEKPQIANRVPKKRQEKSKDKSKQGSGNVNADISSTSKIELGRKASYYVKKFNAVVKE